MSANWRKAWIEFKLLEIWFGGHQPNQLTRLVLNTLEFIYKLLRVLTRQNQKSKLCKKKTQPPLLVVGNLIAGGAGKTPIVMAICQYFYSKNKRVGIVSRGYGRASSQAILIDPSKPMPKALQVGDEPLFLCAQTHCPVAVCADRSKAVTMLLTAFPTLDLIVSDDGLQHHRLARQIEWVVFDERGQGNGRLLPAGPLREPLNRLESVDAVLCANTSVKALEAALNMPNMGNWHSIRVSLCGFRHLLSGKFATVDQAKHNWNESTVLAFTGIGNPDKLFNSLLSAGIAINEKLSLPDHFNYPNHFCAQFDQQVLITTGKDAVKLLDTHLEKTNSKVWVAEIFVELPPALIQALEDSIGPTID